MAQRRAGKAPKGAKPRAQGRRGKAEVVAFGALADTTLDNRIAALERERDDLRLALEQEQARRRSLEQVYAAARDRIARALDSLQTILNAKN
jgi:hypothetical protein